MEIDDMLYKAYLAELEALEKFRMSYTALHPEVPLGREDQDVRRLIESLAFFSARTRVAGQRAVARSARRLFQQHFPHILSPVPAMAIIRAKLDARFVEVTEVPEGSELVMTPEGGGPAARFRTLMPLRVLPIALEGVHVARHGTGHRLLLAFSSPFERNDEVGTLRLHINHLNELQSSLAVHYSLKTAARACSVHFGDASPDRDPGQRCAIRFQPTLARDARPGPLEHPLPRARAALHFPQQDLVMEAVIPTPPRNWRRFTLALELGPSWPTQVRLTPDTFVLHAVPVMNLVRQFASPVEWDATRERVALEHPEPASLFRVHSLAGVFRLDPTGMTPMRAAAITGGRGSFDIEFEGRGDGRRAWLSLDEPEAFKDPVRIAAEAFWHQPVAAKLDVDAVRVTLTERHLQGVTWGRVGSIAPSVGNPLESLHDELLQLLSIKNQRFLQRDDLLFLLEALGVRGERDFNTLLAAISGVEVSTRPFARKTTGIKYVYTLTFKELDPFIVPTLDLLARITLDVLQSWSTDDVVELAIEVPNLEFKRSYSAEHAR